MVRAERLETPEDYIDAIQEAVKKEHIAALYGLWNRQCTLIDLSIHPHPLAVQEVIWLL